MLLKRKSNEDKKEKIRNSVYKNHDNYFDEKSAQFYHDLQQKKVDQKISKQIHSELWLCNQFPMKFSHFKEVLQALQETGN